VLAERVGQGEVGRFQHWAQAWLLLGFSCRKLLVSTGWAVSLLLCMNGLRKQSSGLPFPAVKLFSRSVGVTVGQEP